MTQQELANLILAYVNIWVLAILAALGALSPIVGLLTSGAIAAGWLSVDSGWARFAARVFGGTVHAQSSSTRLETKERASGLISTGLFYVGLAFALTSCAGTFEESTGRLSMAPPRKAADPATCLAISRRASWEQGLAVTGAVLTGVDGIAAWPIDSKDGRLGLAIGGTLLASGTALVLVLWQNDAAAYIEAGCAAPKAVTP